MTGPMKDRWQMLAIEVPLPCEMWDEQEFEDA